MSTAVLNVATGRFMIGQKRLTESLKEMGSGIDIWRWGNHFPPGSPPQNRQRWPLRSGEIPYRFKTYAIKAVVEGGGRQVIWCDASIVAIRSLDPLIEYLRKTGYWLVNGGWNVGQWCADSALAPLGITREDSFQIPLCVGGAFALDLEHPLGRAFFGDLVAMDDAAFCGPWTNKHQQASADPRVRGHRHDQTVMGVIAHRHEMKLIESPRFFDYGNSKMLTKPDGSALSEETILVADGNY